MSVKAVFLYPENGYRHNQEKVRECGLEVGAKYEVSGINYWPKQHIGLSGGLQRFLQLRSL